MACPQERSHFLFLASKARWNIHIFRSAEGWQSDFLYTLPTPQPREDTVKPHLKTRCMHGLSPVLSRNLELLPLKLSSIFSLKGSPVPFSKWKRDLHNAIKHIIWMKVKSFCHWLLHCPTFPLLRQSLHQPLICSWRSSCPVPSAAARITQKWCFQGQYLMGLELNYRFGQLSPPVWAKVIWRQISLGP